MVLQVNSHLLNSLKLLKQLLERMKVINKQKRGRLKRLNLARNKLRNFLNQVRRQLETLNLISIRMRHHSHRSILTLHLKPPFRQVLPLLLLQLSNLRTEICDRIHLFTDQRNELKIRVIRLRVELQLRFHH